MYTCINVLFIIIVHIHVGDGHCLVHAVSRCLVGRELFWHALRVNMQVRHAYNYTHVQYVHVYIHVLHYVHVHTLHMYMYVYLYMHAINSVVQMLSCLTFMHTLYLCVCLTVCLSLSLSVSLSVCLS